MTEECQMCLMETQEMMENAIIHLQREFHKIRAGKANPQMLEGIKVEYYGVLTPLEQMANINTPDPKLIVVQAWDKSALADIDKAILSANLGFNPQNDGEVLRIPVPALTEERRKELVKMAKNEAENTKISIRTIRKNANDMAKKLEKDGVPEDDANKLETDIQGLTNKFSTTVDTLFSAKEKDIMTI